MSAFIWERGLRLEHLDDPVAEAPILGAPLRAHQDEALGPPAPLRIRALAEIPAAARDYLVAGEQVFCTRRLVRRFRQAARRAGHPTAVLALTAGGFTRSTIALGGTVPEPGPGGRAVVRYDLWHRSAAGPPTEEELRAATPVVLEVREHVMPNDVLARRGLTLDPGPQGAGGAAGGVGVIPGLTPVLTVEPVMHVRHWSHLVVANYVALFARWFDLTPGKVLRYVGAVLRAGWPTRYRLLRALSVRGRGVRVHPTAVVEASVLGDGVEVGPFAVVTGSVLGRRSKVDAHASVVFSSLGEGAVVSFQAACNLSVVHPQAMVSLPGAQMAVVGRQATLYSGSFLMDVRDPYLGREVLVVDGGHVVESGLRLLGPCIGHGAVVGAGARIGPGVAVPNGACLVTGGDDVFRRFDEPPVPRQPLVAEDGHARPLRRGR